VIRSPSEIRDAYRDRDVAAGYVDQRFVEPLGALLHARQRAHVKRLVGRLAPTAVLEIAPGPARLTVELADVRGTAIDASLEMLDQARRRLAARGSRAWRFVQGDVFNLPFLGPFDLIYSFRLIRHFDLPDRERIYAQIARLLRPGGTLMFDAVNETVSAPLRREAPPGEYQHFDALLRPDGLRAELARHGLTVTSLAGVQHRYGVLRQLQILVAPRSRAIARSVMEIVDRTGGEPLEWIVTCRRT
jgi:SAM-dependent methyltransferase